MVIERVEYKVQDGVVRPRHKTVLEQVDEHYYLVKGFTPIKEADGEIKWIDGTCSCWFDGKEYHNGILKYAHDGVQKRFEMMIKYEGCVEVK